jgi:hypothetical protein
MAELFSVEDRARLDGLVEVVWGATSRCLRS